VKRHDRDPPSRRDVEVQINSSGLRRCNHAQGDFVAILASNDHDARPIREDRRGEGTFTAPTCRPCSLSAHDPPFRLAGQHLDHVRIQLRRLAIYRCVGEQRWIERSHIGHGILSRS
jgi:hypothetical protein